MPKKRWLSRLFLGSEPDPEQTVEAAPELELGYPEGSLQRHRAQGDLVSDPVLIWRTSGETPGGLVEHIRSAPNQPFTDVLLLLSEWDHAGVTEAEGVPWLVQLQGALRRGHEALVRHDPAIPAGRRLRVRLLADRSEELRGQSFGLAPGEFITGLYPQLYVGKSARVAERVVIHAHLPGVTDGFGRVGVLFRDQVAFTLGSHWLDNFESGELEEPGLYRVFMTPDGGIDHGLRDDLVDRFELVEEERDGVNILTIRKQSQPIAHLLLEVAEQPASAEEQRRQAIHHLRLSEDLDEVLAFLRGWDGQLSAQRRHPNSQIDHVVVFGDKAQVTRARFLRLSKGQNSVRFEGLLPWLKRSQVTAEVIAGQADLQRIKLLSGVEVEAQDRRGLHREALDLAGALELAAGRVVGLLQQRQVLRGGLLPREDTGVFESSLILVRQRLEHVQRSEREVLEAITKEAGQAAALDDRLTPLLKALRRPAVAGQTAVLTLDCPSDGSVEVALRYEVTGARWTPSYKARLQPNSGQLELECQAIVTQQTGEDWQAVTLSLSPHLHAHRAEAPRPRPWTFNSGPDLARLLSESPNSGLTLLSESVEDSHQELLEVNDRATVADGEEERVTFGLFNEDVTQEFVSVPRQDARAFRRVTIARWSGPALPEGALSCYVGDQYFGSSRLSQLTPGQPATVAMGACADIEVRRALVGRSKASNSPEPNQTTHAFHYRTYLRSMFPTACVIHVHDSLPLLNPGAGWLRFDETRCSESDAGPPEEGIGAMRWRLVLEPDKLMFIDTRFSLVFNDTTPALVPLDESSRDNEE